MKKMWKCLKSITGNKQTNTSDEIEFNDVISCDEKTISNKFNQYFVESIDKLNKEIPKIKNNDQNLSININDNTQFHWSQIQIDDLLKTTKNLIQKVNKSEYCNSMVWNDAMDYIAFFVKQIINEVLCNGVIPNDWKRSMITPIPKINNTNKASEFRPINQTEVPDEKFADRSHCDHSANTL